MLGEKIACARCCPRSVSLARGVPASVSGLLRRELGFDLFQPCFHGREFGLRSLENRGLHIELLPVDQIELAELGLQYGFEIALQIAAECPHRLGYGPRQAPRQFIQAARIDKTHGALPQIACRRTSKTHPDPKAP